MKSITLSIATALLATGIASAASAAIPSATVFTSPASNTARADGVQHAGYFYRLRCYWIRIRGRSFYRCYRAWIYY